MNNDEGTKLSLILLDQNYFEPMPSQYCELDNGKIICALKKKFTSMYQIWEMLKNESSETCKFFVFSLSVHENWSECNKYYLLSYAKHTFNLGENPKIRKKEDAMTAQEAREITEGTKQFKDVIKQIEDAATKSESGIMLYEILKGSTVRKLLNLGYKVEHKYDINELYVCGKKYEVDGRPITTISW